MPITSNTNSPVTNAFASLPHRRLGALIWLAFIALALWGLWACMDIGIGWDEEAERATLFVNLAAIQGLLQGSTQAYEALLMYGDRYYGIGFHLPAYALAHILQSALAFFALSPRAASPLVLAHISVWLCFVGSALLVRALLLRLVSNYLLANLGMLTFALWPYLLGHGLMNIKDMPFVFAWLLCTVIALPLVLAIKLDLKKAFLGPSTIQIMVLAITTAWLLSIRIAGVLIFAQYGCLLISHWYCSRASLKRDIKHNLKGHHNQEPYYLTNRAALQFFAGQLAIFLPTFLITLILFYPVAWHNPLELIQAISYMSHHPWEGTTLTAGRFIAPGTKLYFYLPVWLLAKLPLIVLIGLLLTPLAIYRKCTQLHSLSPDWRDASGLWLGLSSGVLMIILALILLRVGLYNELRQTLFLFPLLFLIAITSLFFINAKATFAGLALTCALFIWDNFTLYPYNYSYLNALARQRPATQYFETDYFGFSAANSARWLSSHPEYIQAGCIYAYPMHLLSYELNPKTYPCLKNSDGNARNLPLDQPSLLYITQRNLINFAIPTQCTLIHSEERTLPLSREPLIMGRLFACKPIK